MFASGFVDSDDLVGAIRWERRFHIVMFLLSVGGLVLFATCGLDAPNPNAPGPIEDSWMWMRYTLVLSTVVSVFSTEIYLLFSYNSFYLIHLLTNAYAVTVLAWNAVSMIIVLATCDSQYPQCILTKFTYVVRFCTALTLLGLRILAIWNASNLRATVRNIRRIRTLLIKTNKKAMSRGEARDELAELYNQIRNEQILHVVAMVVTAVAWGFFAVSEMWIVFRQGSDDAWVTWIWWREFLALCTLAPLAITQIYFLLGGTISRAAARWSNWIWVLGVLPVCTVYFLWIYDNCNVYDIAVTLVHPECGTPNVLDNSVQPAFVWRICSFFALYAGAMLNLLVYNTVTHSLMALALLKGRSGGSKKPEDEDEDEVKSQGFTQSMIMSRMDDAPALTRMQEKQAELKWVHHKAFGSPTTSNLLHPSNIKGLIKDVKNQHPDMLLFQGSSSFGKRK